MMKKLVTILILLLFAAGLVMVILKYYYKRHDQPEQATMYQTLAISFFLGGIVLRIIDKFFPNLFGNKPTKEELDEK